MNPDTGTCRAFRLDQCVTLRSVIVDRPLLSAQTRSTDSLHAGRKSVLFALATQNEQKSHRRTKLQNEVFALQRNVAHE